MPKEIEGSSEFWLPDDFFSDDYFLGKNAADASNPGSPATEAEGEVADDLVSGPAHNISFGSFSAFARQNPKPLKVGTQPDSATHGDEALHLLYAAAQLSRISLHHQHLHRCGLAGPHHKMGLPPNRALIQQQLRAARFYELKRLQLMKEQWAAKNRYRFSGNDGRGDEMGLIGPPLQKHAQQEPAVRAVFVNGGRRESKGTGVFIPRRAGAQTEPKKNPSCSTVLLPVGVGVGNALNLKGNDGFIHPFAHGGNEMYNEGKRLPLGPQRAAFPAHDVRLPQEWTY